MSLSEESIKFIKEFNRRVTTQDRRGTADPYYFTIRCHEDLAAPIGHTDRTVFLVDESTYTEEELEKYCKENEMDFGETKDEAYEFDLQDVAHNENFFFTEEGYNEHMKLNKHNYHYKQFYSYVVYAHRNPELEGVLKVMKELADEKVLSDEVAGEVWVAKEEIKRLKEAVKAFGKMYPTLRMTAEYQDAIPGGEYGD